MTESSATPPPSPPAPASPLDGSATVATPPSALAPDTTGLYGLGGLALFALTVTGVVALFCSSPNLFVQTRFLPHFFRFGFYGEILLLVLGVVAGYRHVARLQWRHRILRALWIGLMLVCLATQYQLKIIWLNH